VLLTEQPLAGTGGWNFPLPSSTFHLFFCALQALLISINWTNWHLRGQRTVWLRDYVGSTDLSERKGLLSIRNSVHNLLSFNIWNLIPLISWRWKSWPFGECFRIDTEIRASADNHSRWQNAVKGTGQISIREEISIGDNRDIYRINMSEFKSLKLEARRDFKPRVSSVSSFFAFTKFNWFLNVYSKINFTDDRHHFTWKLDLLLLIHPSCIHFLTSGQRTGYSFKTFGFFVVGCHHDLAAQTAMRTVAAHH
jgi:hypothetical protein